MGDKSESWKQEVLQDRLRIPGTGWAVRVWWRRQGGVQPASLGRAGYGGGVPVLFLQGRVWEWAAQKDPVTEGQLPAPDLEPAAFEIPEQGGGR